jgi:hypothetical protein
LPVTRRAVAWATVAPLPAVLIGLRVMSVAHVPTGIWLQNVAAVGAGLLVLWAVRRCRWRRERPGTPIPWAVIAAALVLMALTLVAPGLQGVHRWLPVGPIRLHAGALLAPALLIAVGEVGPKAALGVGVVTLAIFLTQPDRAQAVSFAAGWLALTWPRRGTASKAATVVIVLLAVGSILRTDPLMPVPYVEGIVGLAAEQGIGLAVAGVIALAILPIAVGLLPARRAAIGVATYLTGALIAPGFGPYPVPILGYGMSPILGYYLGVAGLEMVAPLDQAAGWSGASV